MFKLLSGILIGTCMILPGVSGSVVAMMLGIYEEVIYLLNSSEKLSIKIKKLLPLSIGIIIGVFIFGKILLLFYEKYTYQMLHIFIGLILGGIPTLTKEINRINKKVLIISLLISTGLLLLPIRSNNNLNFVNLFVGGFLYMGGKVIPGISSSLFLMILGLYEYFLNLVTFHITISVIPFILGSLLGLYIFVKLINYLLSKHFDNTYSAIIGFILGSVLTIYPGFELTTRGIISTIFTLISFILVYKLSKK